jgi:hypothetical protein
MRITTFVHKTLMDQVTLLRDALRPHLAWHGARLSFVAAFLIALLRVKTVNFAELATGFSGKAQTDSHYKRLQRFFRSYELNYTEIAQTVVALIDIPEPLTLSLDRTEWQKALITGGVIGISILGGALLLKAQIPGFLSASSPSPSPSPTIQSSQIAASPAPSASPSPVVIASQNPQPPVVPQTAPQQTPVQAAVPSSTQSVAPSPFEQPAISDGTNATIVGQSGSKNIRSGPGTNYASQHIAYPGDRVRILSSSQDGGGYLWYKVYFPKSGADGWIAAQLINRD